MPRHRLILSSISPLQEGDVSPVAAKTERGLRSDVGIKPFCSSMFPSSRRRIVGIHEQWDKPWETIKNQSSW